MTREMTADPIADSGRGLADALAGVVGGPSFEAILTHETAVTKDIASTQVREGRLLEGTYSHLE